MIWHRPFRSADLREKMASQFKALNNHYNRVIGESSLTTLCGVLLGAGDVR